MKNLNFNFKRIITLVLVCAFVLSACTFGAPGNSEPSSSEISSNVGEENPTEEPVTEDQNETDVPPEDVVEPPIAAEPEEPNDEPVVQQPEVVSPPAEKPAKDPLHALYTDPALKEQWKTIDDVAEAAQKYYTENFNLTRLVTKDGYLYNYAAKAQVDVNYLISEGFLNSKYANKDCDVLLLDAAQMKKYNTLRINSSESGLTVFSALRNPKDGTYLLATSKSAGGYLTANQYASLLNGYYQNHGNYGTLFSGSTDYNRIISFISMYESKYEEYCVRSVTKDNKYALVTLSTKTNTGNVKQYVLRRNGNIWEVVLEGLENETRVAVAVNKKIPDFNLEMLPDYIIKDYKNGINANNDFIIKYMKMYSLISDDAEIKYISSARDFAYVVLKNEVKYLFIYRNDDWDYIKCASSGDAVQEMKKIKSKAPTFIVLDS